MKLLKLQKDIEYGFYAPFEAEDQKALAQMTGIKDPVIIGKEGKDYWQSVAKSLGYQVLVVVA